MIKIMDGLRLWTSVVLLSLSLAAYAESVDVQIRLAAPSILELRYQLPEQCKELAFLKNGADGKQIRAHWESQDDCGEATGDTLVRRKDSCPVLRFTFAATAEAVRGYPAAFPLEGGIYVHTSNYALADTCGPVRYHFLAPYIATAGQAFEANADADPKTGGDTPALLMQQPIARSPGAISYFDPRLSSVAAAQIKEVADGAVSFLRAELPDLVFRPPILAATLASQPGGPNIGGNASDVLLLTFFNWPQEPGPKEKKQLTLLVTHEFSHRFQMRDAVDNYADARLIHEGGAEFLRWLTSVEKGWLSKEDAAADLDDALTQCILYTDGRAWRDLSAKVVATDRLEYRCGLSAYVYGLAARQSRGNAMSRIDEFYKELQAGKTPDFEHTIECGSDTKCEAQWLPKLLGSEVPMEEQWHNFFATTGLAKPHPPNAQQRDAMVLQALVKLMKDDCEGHRSTTQTPDSVLMDGMSVCKTFHTNLDVTKIEGRAVFGDKSTLFAMMLACQAKREVTLGTRAGELVTVPCKGSYPERKEFYAVDIDRVLASLLRD